MKKIYEFYTEARQRAKRRKSPWNLILIPLVIGGIGSVWYGLFQLMWKIHINIYPEHIQEALAHENICSYVSGKFFMQTSYDSEQNQYLDLHIELRKDVESNESLVEIFIDSITEVLRKINHEYGKLFASVGEKVKPHVKLYILGSEEFANSKMKNKYIK